MRVQQTENGAGWLVIGLLIICALLGRGVYILRPFDSDSAMFIYMGRLISEGGRFGHEIVDNKLPTVGLLMSPIWTALGTSWAAYIVAGMATSVIACFALARGAQRSFGEQAFRPTLLAAIVLLNFHFAVFGGFQLETLHVFFATLAAVAALETLRADDCRDSFAVGLCAGIAAYAKPTGLGVACAFAIAIGILMHRQPPRLLKHATSALLGLSIPAMVFLIYLIQSQTLQDMPELFRQISRYAENSAADWMNLAKPLVVIVIAGFPLLVRGWIFRRSRDRAETTATTSMQIFVVGWLLMEFAGAIMQGRMYAYHFLPIAAPLALLFGMLPRKDRLIPLAASLAPIALLGLAGVWNVALKPDTAPLASSIDLNERAMPGDRLWRDDAPRLLLETGLHLGARHPLTFLFANDDAAPLEYSQAILEEFETLRPRFIVLETDLHAYVQRQRRQIVELERFPARSANYQRAWDEIAAYVLKNYAPISQAGHETIWQRRSFPSPVLGERAGE